MKQELKEPDTQAMVDYFVAMARGQTVPPREKKPQGFGIARQPAAYRIVTPTAQAIERAKEVTTKKGGKRKRPEVIRREPTAKKATYRMPGLD